VMHLFQSPSFGGILGDEMGLGKTLTSLVSMWLDGMSRRGCFSLILTTKSCTVQWAQEIDEYFKSVSTAVLFLPMEPPVSSILIKLSQVKPRWFILEDPNITAQELLDGGYHFVITTPQFLLSQHRRATDYEDFMEEIATNGLEAARRNKRFRKMKLSPPKLSLYSSVYKDLLLPFKHVAFDEAQWGKDIESKTHIAIKALYRVCTLLISGTFVANRWSDIFTFIDLIPGHCFKDQKDFERAFTKDFARPPATQFDNLNRFLLGFVVARPNSVLRLKGATIQHVEFELDEADEDAVTLWMMKWYRALHILQQQRRNHTKPTEAELANEERIMSLVQSAQMLASHSLMSDSLKPEEDCGTISKMIAALRELLSHQTLPGLVTSGTTGVSDDIVDPPSFQDRTVQAAEFLDTEGKNTDVLNKQVFEKCKGKAKKKKRSSNVKQTANPKNVKHMREAWIKQLQKMDSDILSSARVKKIVELILACKEKHPGEKIVVFSHYLRFLDLLHEALRRKTTSYKIRIHQFNGQMALINREVTKIEFAEASSDDLNVMLVTAGCGGAGVNLACASVVIQSEVFWNRNEEMQAWFRVRRPGQKHEVSIYIVVATNSVVDYHIMATRDKKSQVVNEMMAILRREDEKSPDIPEVVPY
jgi:SNF2 family DNA or RNA helicase